MAAAGDMWETPKWPETEKHTRKTRIPGEDKLAVLGYCSALLPMFGRRPAKNIVSIKPFGITLYKLRCLYSSLRMSFFSEDLGDIASGEYENASYLSLSLSLSLSPSQCRSLTVGSQNRRIILPRPLLLIKHLPVCLVRVGTRSHTPTCYVRNFALPKKSNATGQRPQW